ncbi:PREDICTED: patatin-like phospholipase domain-containing protein 1 isoform X3 [Crocodylus porosus]|uniref:patatin-like phospholipase domain-containing protein 1 isoform X3 n=1 Tax=Crocodylus porosus TaxID=8502 RepID=UPI0009405DFC|nr:PREDICTED: patatin-like phospholipase domain-containing protein 1 isoform X3 [Crocodylus porosus]
MFYQMEVMKALQELAPEILRSASKIYGTSSGALIATLVTCGCEIDAVVGYMTETVKNMEGSILGYLYPNNKIILNIQKALEKCLPDNAHQLASGRLHIFLTQVSSIQSAVVSEFSSKEEIIQVLHEFFLRGYHDAGFYLERNREFGIDYLARNITLPLASESHKKCLSQTSGGSWNQNPSTRILTSTDAAYKDLTRQHGAMSRAENETEEKTQQLPLC